MSLSRSLGLWSKGSFEIKPEMSVGLKYFSGTAYVMNNEQPLLEIIEW